MSAVTLISGTFFRGPEIRSTKTGSTVITLTLKVVNGNAAEFWRVAVFDKDVQQEIGELEQGDAVAFVGRLTAEVYSKEGAAPRVSLSLTAERAISLKKRSRGATPFDNQKWAQTA
jgi:single-stranded DNA-binding protein